MAVWQFMAAAVARPPPAHPAFAKAPAHRTRGALLNCRHAYGVTDGLALPGGLRPWFRAGWILRSSSMQHQRPPEALSNAKGHAQCTWPFKPSGQAILLDLAFLVFDVLARNGVVLLDDHLLGHGACVLFGYVEMACARGRVQTDLDRGWLRYVSSPAAAPRRPA